MSQWKESALSKSQNRFRYMEPLHCRPTAARNEDSELAHYLHAHARHAHPRQPRGPVPGFFPVRCAGPGLVLEALNLEKYQLHSWTRNPVRDEDQGY